jgi:GT2 family glycosyltransferase
MLKQDRSKREHERIVCRRSITAVIACHNRREKTITCLQSLYDQIDALDVILHVVVLDDGSSDGTTAAIRQHYPTVEVLKGDGGLFWNRAMRVAMNAAMELDPDYYLLLNDDVRLFSGAISRLLMLADKCCLEQAPAIVVGSTLDPNTRRWSYGGLKFERRLAVRRFVPVVPSDSEELPVDTMNCNCVLIPRAVVAKVGNLEAGFRHQWGDFDYGLRATRSGSRIWLASGYVGECERGTTRGTWLDKSLPLRARWRDLKGVKGVPFGEWLLFIRRHYGVMWPCYLLSPYLKTLFRIGLAKGTWSTTE